MTAYTRATSFFGATAILSGSIGIYMLVIGLIETWQYFSSILTADQISVFLSILFALVLPAIGILLAYRISRSMTSGWKDTVAIMMIFSGLMAILTFSIFPILNV